jgi:hypothetical protein
MAAMKGSGTVNRRGDYEFLLTSRASVLDGAIGGPDVQRIRFRIVNKVGPGFCRRPKRRALAFGARARGCATPSPNAHDGRFDTRF